MSVPPFLTFAIVSIVAFVLGFALHWFISRNSNTVLRQSAATLAAQVAQLEGFREENTTLKMEKASLAERLNAESEKLAWAIQSEQRLTSSFEALASRVLQANSDQLLTANSERLNSFLQQVNSGWNLHHQQIQGLLNPLAADVTKMDQNVRELESKREGAYQALSTQLVQLAEQQNDLRKVTSTLSGALRSTTTRGQWGELQLRRVVELAGMKAHVDFVEQVITDDGRPDMVVFMPNQGALALDAKTPMTAYLDALESTDENIKLQKMNEHANAVYGRINELANKKYWNGIGHTPEVVVMFIPNEACLAAAFETRPSLLDYAMDKKVLVVSPTTLLALLKAIAFGWQQHEITSNAQEIAREAKELYKRLQTFTQHYSSLGKSLNATVQAYNASVGSFESRLATSIDRLQKLGAGVEAIKSPQPIETALRETTYAPSESITAMAEIEIIEK